MFAISPVRNLPVVYLLLMMGLGMTASAVDNHPPVVTNVVAKQVGQQVEIVYDLEDADADLMRVSLQVSSDGVATITFTAGKSGARILKASVDGVELAASVAFMFAGEEFGVEC